MVDIVHSTYTSFPGMENERTHHSFIRFNKESGNILSVLNSLEEKTGNGYPKELIKFYRSDNKKNCDAFLNNYLWAANPTSFNDPFDCPIQLWEKDSFTSENLMKLFDAKAHHFINDNEQVNLQLFQYIRIATLGIISLHEFKDSCQDILWGYYTDQKGFSIKLDTQQLIRQWGNPFRVEYLPPSKLDFFSLNEIQATEDLFPRFLRWTTQKKCLWKEENEWRFIFSNLKADTFLMDAPPSERKKKYSVKAVKEVSLGLKFFDFANSFQDSDNDLYFVADSVIHQTHNQILTFLSDHQEIPVFHMFFQDDLKLHPRKCEVSKINDNRFLIKYFE